MESRAKLFGHAIHPILIVYPLGLLSAAVIFDVIYLATGNTTWSTVSFWMIAAGIARGIAEPIRVADGVHDRRLPGRSFRDIGLPAARTGEGGGRGR